MDKDKIIYVFADFLSFHNELIGKIYVSQTRGKEFYSFEYEQTWIERGHMMLDPDLQLYKGRQYINDDKNLFGVFADSCPDRWGKRLMNRRDELRAKKAEEKPRKLLESDYLLGVYDEARMGGLRFKTDINGEFLSDDKEYATPPWTSLRELEQASIAFENDDIGLDEKWLKQLLAQGSSLGGARPKASVMSPDGSLWIAKFPSKHDDFNSGAWEMVVHDLAVMCGLNVPEAKATKFSKLGTTFLVKRFVEYMVHFQEQSVVSCLGEHRCDDKEIEQMLYEATYDMAVSIMELIDGYSGYSNEMHDIVNTVSGVGLKQNPFIELHDILDGHMKN